MVQDTIFGNVIVFLEKLGVYEVILPFLLVFTIVFAIFERTKVLGTEMIDDKKVTKKNLNAMVAFVIAFLVIASSQLVAIINESMANIVILILLCVSFLVLIGTFFKESEELSLEGGWRTFFMIIVFIGILLVFMDAIKTAAGKTWLSYVIDYFRFHFGSTGVSAVILIIVIIIFMVYIVKDPTPKKKEEEHK